MLSAGLLANPFRYGPRIEEKGKGMGCEGAAFGVPTLLTRPQSVGDIGRVAGSKDREVGREVVLEGTDALHACVLVEAWFEVVGLRSTYRSTYLVSLE